MESVTHLGTEKGGCPSITLPQNSQSAQGGPSSTAPDNVIDQFGVKVWGSEDSLVLNLYGQWGSDEHHYRQVWDYLDGYRARARESQDTGCKIPVKMGGEDFIIRGRGAPIGGTNGVGARYVLERGGYTFYLCGPMYPSGYMFNARVSFSSELLMSTDGAAGAYDEMRRLLACLKFQYHEEQISRVDAAVELAESFEEFQRRWMAGGLIHRFKDWSLHPSGLKLGKGDIVFRVYDKQAELRQARDENKTAVMASRRAGFGDDCLRFEWQLRGGRLKKWDIRTVADWLAKRGPVCEYLMNEHTRLADECKDRTHSARVKASGLWLRALGAFRAMCQGLGSEDRIERVERSGAKVRMLVKQAQGCMASAVALSVLEGDWVQEAGGVMAAMASLLTCDLDEKEFAGRVLDKAEILAACAPSLGVYYARDGDAWESS